MPNSRKSQSLLSYLEEMDASVPEVEFQSAPEGGGTGDFLETGIMRKMMEQGMLSSLDADMQWLDEAIKGHPAKKDRP